ncbi:hypothetical protein [Ferrimonas balearica]|uniref:hypothetical protein n=1 Tax=Ferrimonas balearica TaxID=44012 RepID=UPI001C951332|nr:hypothetical protein [Ferrimonas balearica]MBY5980040.1 hypothetical protein [Ferrimonas balearica]
MKKIILLSLYSAFTLTGCVSSHQTVLPDIKEVKFPDVEVVTETSLGERMLESGKITSVDGFILYSDVSIFDGIVKSGEYHQIGIKENHKVYGPKDDHGTGIIDVFGSPSPAKPYIDGNTGSLCFLGGFGTRFCSDSVKPIVRKINTYSADGFMQELIYTGKLGDKIRFTYREFQNGVARQAFNVDVEYDLSESNQISYKGATVEIIDASNKHIKYKVIRHFN